jgi:hypothetical protein
MVLACVTCVVGFRMAVSHVPEGRWAGWVGGPVGRWAGGPVGRWEAASQVVANVGCCPTKTRA